MSIMDSKDTTAANSDDGHGALPQSDPYRLASDHGKLDTSPEEEKPAAPQQQSDVPDGGLAAWSVVLGAFCSAFVSFGWINSIGVFQEYYESDLLSTYSSSTIAWIPSLQVFFMMSLGPFIGAIYDRFGARYLLIVGMFLHVFGLMMASISKEYYQILLSQGVCSAIGAGTVFQPSVAAISTWFSTRRGLALGVVASGSSLGGVIFPIMVTRMIRNPHLGFPWAMRISAFLILALLIIAVVTVRSRTPPTPYTVTLSLLGKPWTELNFVLLNLGLLVFTFGLFVPVNYLQVYTAQQGLSRTIQDYTVPILNAASLFGLLGSGVLADKIGRYNVFCVVCYVTGILTLAMWIPAHDQATIIAYDVLFGFFSGAYVSLIAALIFQVSPITEIGFRVGLIYFTASWGGLTTNPIAGAILGSHFQNWVGLKIFSGVFCVAGTTFVFVSRLQSTGWKLVVKF